MAQDPEHDAFAILRTVEQLAAFNATAKALMATFDMGAVLEVVEQTVGGLLGACSWALLLWDEERHALKFEAGSGEGWERLRRLALPLETGHAAKAFLEASSVQASALTPKACFFGVYGPVERSVLSIPLQVRGKSLGVLELVSDAQQPQFSDEQRRGAEGIADLAAMAIDNATTFQRIQALSIHDEHTGLFNARHLHAELNREMGRINRFHRALSLLFLDLDRFKQINDQYGHPVGSAVLREVGEVLAGAIRKCDSAYRYGGDEFAVMLLETGAEGALTVAQRIRDRLRAHAFSGGRHLDLHLSASIGIATAPIDGTTGADLIRAADREMYRVKAAGRDGISTSKPVQDPRPTPVMPADPR